MEPIPYPAAEYTPQLLYSNTQWTNSLLHVLARCGHVFVLNNNSDFPRITFPRLTLLDAQSEIPFAMFIRYYKNRELHLYLGAVRKVCGNPLLFTSAVDGAVDEPKNGFSLEKLSLLLEQVDSIRSKAQKRVNWMQRLRTKNHHLDEIKTRISPDLGQFLPVEPKIDRLTQWHLFNLLTHHISREVDTSRQIPLLLEASRIFKL